MDRTFLLIGALAGAIGVALGAFGAHGLRSRVPPAMLGVFETGVRYHIYHALALLIVGALADPVAGHLLTTAGWSFATGILLFSGSLYALATTGNTRLGAITPLGGLAFLLGWACLAAAVL